MSIKIINVQINLYTRNGLHELYGKLAKITKKQQQQQKSEVVNYTTSDKLDKQKKNMDTKKNRKW